MVTKEKIMEFIIQHFKDVGREGGLSLREADVLQRQDTEAEREKARILDDDLNWQDVSIDDLKRFQVLPYLDPIGFRYYLPAYMLWILKEYDRVDPDILIPTIRSLIPTGQERLNAFDKVSTLNQQQAETVAFFLEFLMENHPDDAVWSVAQAALESYWQRFFYRH
ncbi:MAG: hypothetical protein K8S27_14595 [Candidatus Omnitrophica bacterium]|nr:hypothetical protein [Candidatus Omnitrophota bacterium]